MDLRCVTPNDIAVDEDSAQREMAAAIFMRQLLRTHTSETANLAALDRRVTARVLCQADVVTFLRLCQRCRSERAW